MIVLQLVVSIDGLGNEGQHVAVDPEKSPVCGDWVLTQEDGDLRFCRFVDGLDHMGAVIGVH